MDPIPLQTQPKFQNRPGSPHVWDVARWHVNHVAAAVCHRKLGERVPEAAAAQLHQLLLLGCIQHGPQLLPVVSACRDPAASPHICAEPLATMAGGAVATVVGVPWVASGLGPWRQAAIYVHRYSMLAVLQHVGAAKREEARN